MYYKWWILYLFLTLFTSINDNFSIFVWHHLAKIIRNLFYSYLSGYLLRKKKKKKMLPTYPKVSETDQEIPQSQTNLHTNLLHGEEEPHNNHFPVGSDKPANQIFFKHGLVICKQPPVFFCHTRIWQNHIIFPVVQKTQNH